MKSYFDKLLNKEIMRIHLGATVWLISSNLVVEKDYISYELIFTIIWYVLRKCVYKCNPLSFM